MAVQRIPLARAGAASTTPRARLAAALGLSVPATVRRSTAPRGTSRTRVTSRAVTSRRHAAVIVADAPAIRRSIPRPRGSVLIIGTILVVTVVGLTYTTQLLAAAGDRYQIDRLLMERDGLLRTLRSQAGTIARVGSQSEVERWALQDGLDRVGDTIRVTAR
jgi:hypothetical protein